MTIVECRDYNKKLDVTHVDGLHSKMQDVTAQKAVLVSPKGFSGTAKKKAKRLGITLATLEPAAADSAELRSVGVDVPVLLTEIADLHVRYEGVLLTKDIQGSPEKMKQTAHVPAAILNGIDLFEAVHDAFRSGELPKESHNAEYEWVPSDIEAPYYWGNANDDPQLPLDSFKIKISHSTSYYFGHVSEFSNSLIFKNISQNSGNLIFDLEDIQTERDQLARYKRLEEIPLPSRTVAVRGIAVPEIGPGNLKVVGLRK